MPRICREDRTDGQDLQAAQGPRNRAAGLPQICIAMSECPCAPMCQVRSQPADSLQRSCLTHPVRLLLYLLPTLPNRPFQISNLLFIKEPRQSVVGSYRFVHCGHLVASLCWASSVSIPGLSWPFVPSEITKTSTRWHRDQAWGCNNRSEPVYAAAASARDGTMATNKKIEWTEATWSPVRGCTMCSPGCANCYAERIAARFSAPGKPFEGAATMTPHGPRWTGDIICLEDSLFKPLRWKKPRMIFVNSVSDLFHEGVPFDFILRVFEVMAGAHWHTFQVLTKRSRRCADLSPHLRWPRNVWMGVSIENADYVGRLDDLRRTKAKIKFLLIEPLLGPLPSLDLKSIDWVIVGGESGPHARPIDPAWVADIHDQCRKAGSPFFFKQWGHIRNNPDPRDPTAKQNGGKAKGGRHLEGRTWDEIPIATFRNRGVA